MSRRFGVDHSRTDERGDLFAAQVDAAINRVARATARGLSATPSVLDLAGVRGTWANQVRDVLLPLVEREWRRAADETWNDVADAIQEDRGVLVVVGAAADTADGVDVAQRPAEAVVNVGTAVVPKVTIEAARAYLAGAQNRLVGVGDFMYEWFHGELLEGLRQGEGSEVIAKRLRDVAGMAMPRARVVARTEVIGATNRGAYSQMLALGLPAQKTWLATSDSRTRPAHLAASGQQVDLTGSFTVGGFPMDGPHDPLAPPEQTISCRCTLTYEVDTSEPEPSSTVPTASTVRDEADFAQEAMTVEANGVAVTDRQLSRKTGGDFYAQYSEQERTAQKTYASGTTFFDVRDAWRAGKPYLLPDGSNLFDVLKASAAKTRTVVDGKLYRAMRVPRSTLSDMTTPGAVIEHDFYTSTSSTYKDAYTYGAAVSQKGMTNVVLEILTPKGTAVVPGIPHEWVLEPGRKMVVRRSYRVNKNKTVIVVDLQ